MLKTALFRQADTTVPEQTGITHGTLSSIPAIQLGRGTHVPLAVAIRLEPPPGCSRQAAARGTAVGTAWTPAMYTLKEEGMLPGACSSMTPVLWSANSSFTPCRAAHELQPSCMHAWSIRCCATCTHGVVTLFRSACVTRQAITDACIIKFPVETEGYACINSASCITYQPRRRCYARACLPYLYAGGP